MAKIPDEKFKEAAKIFLRRELESGSLKQIYSQGRQVGGTGYIKNEIVDVSLGNIMTTSPERPARTIRVSLWDGESKQFSVEEIYQEIKNQK